jgi:hypothetical protein
MRAFAAAIAVAGLAACAKPVPPPAGPNVVRLMATEYAFGMPDTLPAGLTTFQLVNGGQEPHHAVLVRLTEEHPMADVMAAIESPTPPAWVELATAPNQAAPGDSTNTTTILEPGHYLVLCFIPSPDGTPHVAKGMMKEFHVTGTVPAEAALPASDITITLKDYEFVLSTPLTAGTHTIRVENAGPQWHEVGIERLAEGKTMADYQAWAAAPQGPPPTRPMGGVIGPAPGGRPATFTVTLAPGTYLLTCFVPDSGDQKPHVAHGMLKEIVVN